MIIKLRISFQGKGNMITREGEDKIEVLALPKGWKAFNLEFLQPLEFV